MTRQPSHHLLAFDIGGAAIKAADGCGWTHCDSFALWREWRRLPEVLTRIAHSRTPRGIVATMTGEIADCYSSRAAGVAHIVGALVEAARATACPGGVGVYGLDGTIMPAAAALQRPLAVAAANWHALARLAAARAETDRCFLIDVGSTTTDIIPLADRIPVPLAIDDAGRMDSGELVYTGCERTPLPALVRWLPHRGLRRPVAAERFAESRDVWLLLGGLPEQPAALDTADGGPATREAARGRLARTLLLEPAAFSTADAVTAAEWCAAVQARLVARALERVARKRGWRPTSIVMSGHGEALARRALARTGWHTTVTSLTELLGADAARVAPCHALALIALGMLR